MRISQLEIENVKRVRAAKIEPMPLRLSRQHRLLTSMTDYREVI